MGNPVVHFELGAADDGLLVAFYGKLFGWELQGGPGGYTAIDTKSTDGINGGIRQSPDGRPYTAFYVATGDLQATLGQANALGGTTTVPVTDFGPAGRRAMFADPDGLPVGLVQFPAEAQAGAGYVPSAGSGEPPTWFEVMGSDAARTQQFYAGLFGWTVDHSFPAYGAVDTGAGRGIAGGLGGGLPTRWSTVYAKVDDTERAMRRVAELGGTPITDQSVPTLKRQARAALYGSAGRLRMGAFYDPAGNVFGAWDYGTG
jgi:predicted enzyme related to lactoylglutathione lyase